MKLLQRIALTGIVALSLISQPKASRSDSRPVIRRRTTRIYNRSVINPRVTVIRRPRIVRVPVYRYYPRYYSARRLRADGIGPWHTEIVNGILIFYRYENGYRVNYRRFPYRANGRVRYRYVRI